MDKTSFKYSFGDIAELSGQQTRIKIQKRNLYQSRSYKRKKQFIVLLAITFVCFFSIPIIKAIPATKADTLYVWGTLALTANKFRLKTSSGLKDDLLRTVYENASAINVYRVNSKNLNLLDFKGVSKILSQNEYITSLKYQYLTDPSDKNDNVKELHLIGTNKQIDSEIVSQYLAASNGSSNVLHVLIFIQPEEKAAEDITAKTDKINHDIKIPTENSNFFTTNMGFIVAVVLPMFVVLMIVLIWCYCYNKSCFRFELQISPQSREKYPIEDSNEVL